VLQHGAADCVARGGKGVILTDNERHRNLLDRVRIPAKIEAPEFEAHHYGIQFLNDLGADVVSEGRSFVHKLNFLGNYLAVLALSLARPASIRWTSLFYHMQQTGVAAVPIVALLTFLIGVVVAYMGAEQMLRFGAEIFVVNLIEVTTMREMGVLITAIVVAGRSGSAFTAQIGAMMANEEVAAMRTMGLDPMRVLVLPRVLALMLMLPALVFLADIMGLLGGGLATCFSVRMSAATFVARLQEVASVKNFLVGLVKSPFFALVIGVTGCFQGFQATGSAESVGRLTTKAVVESIFLVIVLNAAFAVFFTTIRI
jgi:phospholipid/cholesterol/gamma-HCH transport system permease protein